MLRAICWRSLIFTGFVALRALAVEYQLQSDSEYRGSSCDTRPTSLLKAGANQQGFIDVQLGSIHSIPKPAAQQ